MGAFFYILLNRIILTDRGKYCLAMKSEADASSEAAVLRRRAEERLRVQKPEASTLKAEVFALELYHELEVLQIELEMQVAELRQAAAENNAAQEKYRDFY